MSRPLPAISPTRPLHAFSARTRSGSTVAVALISMGGSFPFRSTTRSTSSPDFERQNHRPPGQYLRFSFESGRMAHPRSFHVRPRRWQRTSQHAPWKTSCRESFPSEDAWRFALRERRGVDGRTHPAGRLGNVCQAPLTGRGALRRLLVAARPRAQGHGRKHDYPSDKQEKATATVLEPAALLSAEWATA